MVTKATDVDDGYALIGVVSFGDGCGDSNKYGVSTEFSNYLEWVAQHFDLTGGRTGFFNEEKIRQKRSKLKIDPSQGTKMYFGPPPPSLFVKNNFVKYF